MMRDMDLIRALLLKLEALQLRMGDIVHITPDSDEVHAEGYSMEQIDYHLSVINDANLIDTGGARPMVGIGFRRLTPSGHYFLDNIRDPCIWEKTKVKAGKVVGVNFAILLELAIAEIKARRHLP